MSVCVSVYVQWYIFLSFRVFRLLSSSLLLYSQTFGRHVLRVSWRTRGPKRNFEPRPLFNSRASLALIPLTITGYNVKYSRFVTHRQLGVNLPPLDNCHSEAQGTNAYYCYGVSCKTVQSEFLRLVNLMFLHHYEWLLLCYFFTWAHITIFF